MFNFFYESDSKEDKMRKKIFLIASLSILSFAFADEKTNAFNMVNDYRQIAGMTAFEENSYLDAAAYNHSHYMAINNLYGHYEDSSLPGYTGYSPSDRAYYVGYLSSVTENFSFGTLSYHNYKESVSGLFSAIYHRFGFLSFDRDEMGVGVDSNNQNSFYTYDMGNSLINALCGGDSFNGYGEYIYGVCKDYNFKIEVNNYLNAIDSIKAQNPPIVIWPPKESNFTEPVFYEEYPDPLPNQSVSGYPVSISFNDYYFQNIIVKSFTLKDFETNETINTKLMDKESDPNGEFSENEFAIFPLERLKWGGVYKAEVVYEINGTEHTLSWCYETKDYPYKRYTITSDTTLKVMPKTKYMLYIKPQDENDKITGFGTSSNIPYDIGFIDNNTLYFETNESNGYVDISLNNNIDITLQVSNSDSAVSYVDKSNILKLCSNPQELNSSDENLTPILQNEQNVTVTNGWNLISLPVDENISYDELNSTFKSAELIWKYKDGWRGYGKGYLQNLIDSADIPRIEMIKKGEGFWVKSDGNDTITFNGDDYNISVANLNSGWHLLGVGKDINVTELVNENSSIQTIWIYKNGWYAYGVGDMQQLLDKASIPKIDEIKDAQGFWVYIK